MSKPLNSIDMNQQSRPTTESAIFLLHTATQCSRRQFFVSIGFGMTSFKFITLSNGVEMPSVGLGTWRAPDAEVEQAIETALEAGYRHFDCAPVYNNEKAVGRVLKRWIDEGKVLRNELWITTKLPPHGNRAADVEICLRQSLSDLQLEFVDLYLVHMPVVFPNEWSWRFNDDGTVDLDTAPNLLDTWTVMEEMVEKSLTKAIGVSNFNQDQVQRILDNCKIKPVNLQIELHLYLQQRELVEFCQANEIAVVAYSPLGSRGIEKLYLEGKDVPNLLEDPDVLELAEKYHKSPAQILLRHSIQRDVGVIPKSTNSTRLKENLDIFDFGLSTNEMEKLYGLDKNIRICDLTFIKGIDNHPEYPWKG